MRRYVASLLGTLAMLTSCASGDAGNSPTDIRLEQWEWHVAFEQEIVKCMRGEGFEYQANELARPDEFDDDDTSEGLTSIKLEISDLIERRRLDLLADSTADTSLDASAQDTSSYVRALDGEIISDGTIVNGCRQTAALEIGPFPAAQDPAPAGELERYNERVARVRALPQYQERMDALRGCIRTTGYERNPDSIEEELIAEAALLAQIAEAIEELEELELRLHSEADTIWESCGSSFLEFETWFSRETGI